MKIEIRPFGTHWLIRASNGTVMSRSRVYSSVTKCRKAAMNVSMNTGLPVYGPNKKRIVNDRAFSFNVPMSDGELLCN